MCWKKNCMSPNQCQDTYSVFMRVCVCAHTCNYTHVKTINGFTYTQSCTFTCRCFQSLTAQKTGLSCSNEKHMCSSRLNLLQAHLLLAKHFHLHLNQSVSFLSVSSVSMCVGWINVLAKCCVWEWWCIRMTYTVYGMFARVICPFRSPCLTPYSSLSILSFHFSAFLHFSCCEADKYTLCFFKQWPPWYEPGSFCWWNHRKTHIIFKTIQSLFFKMKRCNNNFLGNYTWAIFLATALKWVRASK